MILITEAEYLSLYKEYERDGEDSYYSFLLREFNLEVIEHPDSMECIFKVYLIEEDEEE